MPPFRRITSAATQHVIRRTLRAALNTAIAQQYIPNFNPAAHVELEAAKKPKALIWTEERVRYWEETGEKPSPVMVWTPEQTGAFLDHVVDHPLYPLWRLIAFRGLRRGEALGSRWTDLNWKEECLSIATQLVQDGWEVVEGEPKTNSGIRTIALDTESVELLRAHQLQQKQAKLSWGDAWVETGRIFTQGNGEWLHPGKTSDLFDRLVVLSGLPPIRLHDLRHGAATLALAAGVDIKVVSEMLGHSDTSITRDIYQAVLDDLARAAAEAVVQLVPRARRRSNALPSRSPQHPKQPGRGSA
jgi:integrase